MKTIAQIDQLIRLNWSLIKDGPCDAVDGVKVRRKIDELLEERLKIGVSSNGKAHTATVANE